MLSCFPWVIQVQGSRFRNLPILGVRQLPKENSLRGLGPQQSIPPGGPKTNAIWGGGWRSGDGDFCRTLETILYNSSIFLAIFLGHVERKTLGRLKHVKHWNCILLVQTQLTKHPTKVGAEDDFPFNIWSSNLWIQTPCGSSSRSMVPIPSLQ